MRISIDDCGANLGKPRRFPFDEIKVDHCCAGDEIEVDRCFAGLSSMCERSRYHPGHRPRPLGMVQVAQRAESAHQPTLLDQEARCFA